MNHKKYAVLIPVLTAFLIYIPTWAFPFVNIDDWWLVHSPKLLDWLTPQGLWKTFFDLSKTVRLEHGAEYLPVRDIWSALQFSFFGDHPMPYHIVQSLLFSFSIFLLVHLLNLLNTPPLITFTAALLFAVHPIHVEPVVWLTGQKDLLSLIFFEATLVAYARQKYHWVFLFFVVGLGSKYQLFVTPLLFPFVDRVLKRPIRIPVVALFLCIALAAATFFTHVGKIVRFAEFDFQGGFFAWARNSFFLFYRSISLLLAPNYLQIRYPVLSATDWSSYAVVAGIFESILCCVGLAWGFIRRRRVALAVAFLVAGFLPMLRINLLADRYLLISSIGFMFLIAELFSLVNPTAIQNSIFAALVVCYAALTLTQEQVWKTSLALWSHAAAGEVPVDLGVLENQAILFRDEKRWKESESVFRDYLSRVPKHDSKRASILVDLGYVEIQQGKLSDAEAHSREAIQLNPNSIKAHINLGVSLAQQRKNNEARKVFLLAEKLDPKLADIHFNLALLAVAARDRAEVQRRIEILKRLAPTDIRLKMLERAR